MISFLYTGFYSPPPANGLLYSDNGTCALLNAFYIPNLTTPTPETIALLDALRHTFHLHMYSLASTLHYPALRTFARDKLWDILHGIMRPSIAMGARWILRECIDACSASLGSDTRLCADDGGLLAETIVAAVLTHEVRTWNKVQRDGLRSYLTGPQYEAFWDVYHGVTAENAELLAPVFEAADAGPRRVGAKKALPVKKGGRVDEAQKRRGRKEQLRKGLALIEEQEAADLAAVMAANSVEKEDFEIERHEERLGRRLKSPAPAMALTYRTKVGGVQHDRRLKAQVANAALPMNAEVLNSVDKEKSAANSAGMMGASHIQMQHVVASGHGENEGFLESTTPPSPTHINLAVEIEMQDAMRRMHIDDRAQK